MSLCPSRHDIVWVEIITCVCANEKQTMDSRTNAARFYFVLVGVTSS